MTNKSIGSEILQIILNDLGITIYELAKKCGYSREQAFYDVLNGKTKKISGTMGSKIVVAFPKYNLDWILTGNGEMLKAPTFQTQFLEEGGRILPTNEVTPVEEERYMMVEYADLRASAGRIGMGDVEQLPETHRRLVPREFENGKFLVVRVDGDSMDDGTKRSLSDGDEVLIKEKVGSDIWHSLPIKKTLFVITSREGNVLKQITEINLEENYIKCHSFNPLYKDFTISFQDIYQVFVVCKVINRQISLI